LPLTAQKAARKLIEIANSVEPAQDGRIYIELINAPFLYEAKGSPDEYLAALKQAIARGWLTLDRSGTYVKFTAMRSCSPDGKGWKRPFDDPIPPSRGCQSVTFHYTSVPSWS
jgi:hypothetical protein